MSKPLRAPSRPLARAGTIAAILVGMASLSACKPLHASSGLLDAVGDGSSIDLETSFKQDLLSMCLIMGVSADGEPACKAAKITDICSLNYNSLDEATHFLADAKEVSSLAKSAQDRADFEKSLQDDFRDGVDHCLNAEKYKNQKVAQEIINQIQNDPDLPKKRLERRAAWVRSLILSTGSQAAWAAAYKDTYAKVLEAVDSSGAKILDSKGNQIMVSRAPYAFVRLVGSSLCSMAVNSLVSFSTSAEVNWNKDQCAQLDASVNSWQNPACKASLNTLCASISGVVNLREIAQNFPSADSSGDSYLGFVEDTASAALYMGCNRGGDVASMLCGVIGQSTNQIAKALQTGDNDWGECLFGQYARCFGQRWLSGSGNWTNDAAIEMPRQDVDKNDQSWWVRSCCLCRQTTYGRSSGAWRPTAAEWDSSVIQQGDFKSGNCGVQEGKKTSISNQKYTKYDACQRVDVLGNSCSLVKASGSDAPVPNDLTVWDAAQKNVTGQTISKARGMSAKPKPPKPEQCRASATMGYPFLGEDGSTVLDCTGRTYVLCKAPRVCCTRTANALDTIPDPNACADLPLVNPVH